MYRFLDNPKITEQLLSDQQYMQCRERSAGRDLLVLCDTSEFHLNKHKGRIKDFTGLGATTKKYMLGFFLHAALVIDKQNYEKIGWAHQNLYNRDIDHVPLKRSSYSIPIEEKESFRWLTACKESREQVLDLAKSVTYVMDREADIYELMETLNGNSDFIIRAKHNRRVFNDKGESVKLLDDIETRKCKSIIEVKINGSRKRNKRIAKCELKYGEYIFPISKSVYNKANYKKSIKVRVVKIQETKQSTPDGEEPISWILITNKPVNSITQAVEIIGFYAKRWDIEEAFRLLKKKGFNIENTQLETGERIRKWLLLGMEAAIKVMQLKSARNGDTEQKTKELFDVEEIECLEILNNELQGSTEKLQNRFDKINLAWACWIISRLGGWDGYMSQRPPGTITIKRGLDRFSQRAIMYKMIKNSP